MLASHRQADREPVDPMGVRTHERRSRPYGVKRIAQAYGITVLAAVLGLPVAAAGLITANNCVLQGQECDARMSYGTIGGIVLAVVIQLVLAVHFRLGWAFWVCSTAIISVSMLGWNPWRIVLGMLLAPGIAAWVSDPPNRRTGGVRHWAPRLGGLIISFGAVTAAALLA